MTLAALVVYAARSGPAAVTVAVMAVPLLLVLMVLASRIASEALGNAAKSRVTLEAASLQYGLFIAAMLIGWAAISMLVDIAGDVGAGFSDLLPGWLSTTIRVLPSGWGVVAVDAAARGDWLLAAVALAGLAALVPLGAVIGKDLRTWSRDPRRSPPPASGCWRRTCCRSPACSSP